jgi:hypothetical protein
MASSISPNQTLYVHNLNEKLTKEGLFVAGPKPPNLVAFVFEVFPHS